MPGETEAKAANSNKRESDNSPGPYFFINNDCCAQHAKEGNNS